jgi:hypothetical protein
VQRAPARFEHRGGVEDYALAAARALAPEGRFVACEASIQAARIDDAARAAVSPIASIRRSSIA